MTIKFVSFDSAGIDSLKTYAIYEYNDRRASIDGSIPGEDPTIITSAVRTAVLAALGIPESDADLMDAAQAYVDATNIVAIIEDANGALNVPDLCDVVAELAYIVGQLARAVGLTPTTEES